MKIISFAFAGGDGYIYHKIKKELSSIGIIIIPYLYRGRNGRYFEGNYKSIDEIGTEAVKFIQEAIKEGEEYVLLGHSMGSLVAFDCYQKIVSDISHFHLPNKVIFSGMLPPNKLSYGKFELQDDEVFMNQLLQLGAITSEMLDNPEFRKYFLPIIKNDVLIFEGYRLEKYQKIEVPIIVLTGQSDEISGEKILGWREFAIKEPDFIELKGNHFFLFNETIDYIDLFRRICS